MSMKSWHSFHISNESPWPLVNSLNSMNLLFNNLDYTYSSKSFITYVSFIIVFISLFSWWRDIIRESSYQGHHTYSVYKGMKYSMMLFILSEILFFLSFFWTMFYEALAPELELGLIWPPQGVSALNPMQMPLLNTLILLSSGATVTWAHYYILCKEYKKSLKNLILTITLGFTFSMLQIMEYKLAEFCMNDSSYGSIFFMATGFHGLHVLIGTLFLTHNAYQIFMVQFSQKHHFSFEAAAWYWHFVDVVWIYLYTLLYWYFS
nr:cytochrome c oxidase subunit 3 [Amblyseius tsugawai]